MQVILGFSEKHYLDNCSDKHLFTICITYTHRIDTLHMFAECVEQVKTLSLELDICV